MFECFPASAAFFGGMSLREVEKCEDLPSSPTSVHHKARGFGRRGAIAMLGLGLRPFIVLHPSLAVPGRSANFGQARADIGRNVGASGRSWWKAGSM